MFVLAENASALDKLLYGLRVMLLGMGTVFAVLLLIWLVLMIFQLVFAKSSKKNQQKPAPNPEPIKKINVEKAVEPIAPVQVSQDDDQELVAVIIAAICAAEGVKDPSSLRIVSCKRKKTPWNRK